MELQEFAFLGRVRQFLKQRSCLGANISLYCLSSEGSQESKQEGGRCSRIFLPSIPKKIGASKWGLGGHFRPWGIQRNWVKTEWGAQLCRVGKSGRDMNWSLVQVQPKG